MQSLFFFFFIFIFGSNFQKNFGKFKKTNNEKRFGSNSIKIHKEF